MTDNIEVAVLSKLNELASRHGIKPYHFIATLKTGPNVNGMAIVFVVPSETSAREASAVTKMFDTLRVENGVLKGGEVAIIDALDKALAVAPKHVGRS
jgi:hypothetical protein